MIGKRENDRSIEREALRMIIVLLHGSMIGVVEVERDRKVH